jgi:hypothetical protein
MHFFQILFLLHFPCFLRFLHLLVFFLSKHGEGVVVVVGSITSPQFYIQLVNRPHLRTGILLFEPFGQSGQ